jgi:hypothetical protein
MAVAAMTRPCTRILRIVISKYPNDRFLRHGTPPDEIDAISSADGDARTRSLRRGPARRVPSRGLHSPRL